ncbi:transporter substrate-binding domain-containing protein [Bacteriovorax sp. DB6_IX]|uniref:transporter substrate-binding domain-containing protein n=1 Tax=Bacteriovorax sp. DB6_IX TaxID=1353530 RepID=UPI00038A4393|nr:transporter substrate-binding domain-containing protein [Bacteriovorax sp. DB6_IX]EQC50951.1 ABC transporter, substrate-binding protein, family 3 [Bacteriovorax sp. DB6_IX]
MKRLSLIILTLFSFILFHSCQGEDINKFRYAVSGEFKPFSYVDENGKLQGFDVELGKLIGLKLGKEPEAVKYKFSGIIEGLKSGRFNAAVASHTVTSERKKHVNFSIPYYYSGAQVFSRNEKKVIELENLEIAVSKGSTYQRFAQKLSKNVKVYDSDNTALEALSRGRHDLVITDRVTGAMAIKNGLKIFPNQQLSESQQAIALSKESEESLKQINKILEEFSKDGTLKQLSQKYFGSDITKE